MTEARLSFMDNSSHDSSRRMVGERPRERLSRFLRDKYRGASAIKRLAVDMDATPKAAENALIGHWPGDLHFAAIVRRFGRDVLDAVFAPEIEPVLAKLKQQERDLEEALAAARTLRRQAEGGAAGVQGSVAEVASFTRDETLID